MRKNKENTVIELKDVWKIYDLGEVRVEALRGVNLKVREGEFLAIVGESGSGKSTLLHILGLLDLPTRGKVIIDQKDTSRLSDDELARVRNEKIGFVFQSFNLISSLTALENVMLPMLIKGIDEKEAKERAIHLLEKLNIGNRINHKPNQLSGGQRQRVAIARALANDPRFILADEPTGNLDSKNSEEVMEIFSQLNKEGKTIILVTHSLAQAEKAGRIIELKDGRFVREKQINIK